MTQFRAVRVWHARRRGAIFIAAMWVLLALVGLVLVMARWARVQSQASGNRVADAQAAMAERAGEQYVLSQIAATGTDATFSQQPVPEAVPVGAAYFWVVRPDTQSLGYPEYGVTDEGSKLNINTATLDQLLMLPGMTPDVAAAIIDWRDPDETPGQNGAEQESYPNYRCKNGPFETVEELLLVRGITPDLLYGMDANRNGTLDLEEASSGGSAFGGGLGGVRMSSGGDVSRGWFPFLSVTGPGAAPQAGQGGGQQLTNVNGNVGPVLEVLRNALDTTRFNEVAPYVQSGRPFRNMLDFYVKTRLKPEEYALVAGKLTATVANAPPNDARVNINTASREVLRCLPGLEDADATALVNARVNADTTSIAWVADAIDKNKATAIGDRITSQTYRYSADVVGVSGDGRAYRRARIMVDASASPAKIVYRRELTDSGWPLEAAVRDALRRGEGVAGGQTIMSSSMR